MTDSLSKFLLVVLFIHCGNYHQTKSTANESTSNDNDFEGIGQNVKTLQLDTLHHESLINQESKKENNSIIIANRTNAYEEDYQILNQQPTNRTTFNKIDKDKEKKEILYNEKIKQSQKSEEIRLEENSPRHVILTNY